MRVGFIGLGAMGKPMALNILRGGHDVTVFDLNAAAVAELRESGARAVDSVGEIADGLDVLITMLPKPADVEGVLLGPDGAVDSLPRGATVIDMSTGDPLSARRIATALEARGIALVDCPVGRTQDNARAGTLLLMAGGEDAVIDEVTPVLMAMGDEIIRCGPVGAGQAMKLVNNMLSIIVTQAIAETLELGVSAGLSLDVIRAVTGKTMAKTAMMDTGLPAKAFTGDIVPGFALRLAQKDIGLATDLAASLGIRVPVADATLARCVELADAGHAADDIGVIVTSSLQSAGLDLVATAPTRS